MARKALEVKTINGRELEERCAREGDIYISGQATTQNGIFWSAKTSSGGQGVGIVKAPVMKALYLREVTIGFSEEVYGQLLFGQLMFSNNGGPVGNSMVYSQGFTVDDAITIPFNTLIKMDRQYPAFSLLSVISQSPLVNIGVAKTASGTELQVRKTTTEGVDGVFSYTITVTNKTGSATSSEITLTEELPSGLRYLSAAGTGWTVLENAGVITATTEDVIENDAAKTILVNVSVKKKILGGMMGIGYFVDNDINLDAPAIWWNGTSITAGTGTTDYKFAYTYLIRNYIRDERGVPNRVVNRAVSGSHSSHHETLRKFDNRYDPIETPLAAFFEHGVNDSAQSIPTETTVSNMLAYADHWHRIDENIPVIILAPFPVSNVDLEAKQATLRSILKTAVDELENPNIHYVEHTGDMFDPVTEASTYLFDGVHLNNAGNQLVADKVAEYIEENNLFNT